MLFKKICGGENSIDGQRQTLRLTAVATSNPL